MSSTANIPSGSLSPELVDLQGQFAALKDEARQLLSGLKETQFNWRPEPRAWSMAECLLHLNMVGDRYVHVLEKSIQQAKAHGSAGRGLAAPGMLANWILVNTEPPPRRRFKAPRPFTPTDGQPVTAVLPTFLHIQEQLTLQVAESSGLDWRRVKVPAPGLGPLRLNLHVTFAWIAAHERRHLWQARQVRNHAAFPLT